MTETAFEDDKLGRKEIAENFKNILLNTDLNVISVSAPWGGGKTYFIQNLIKLMDNDSINILYNAWESDFYESPLIPLFVELFNVLEKSDKESQLKNDIKWSKKFAKKICKNFSFQLGVNLGVVNCAANFDPNKKMIESEYIELKEKIQEFKSKLKSIQEKLNKKIIIFVDELDRCHPMYTIKTLEIIKHFFGISNIIFVLSVDKKQIENSVRQIFGVNQGEENGYLRKFIDVDFKLPEYNSKEFIATHLIKISDKINKYFFQNNKYYRLNKDYNIADELIKLTDFIFIITNLLKFKLRDLERFFSRFDLLLDILIPNDVLLVEPCIILNALILYSENEFEKYVNNQKSEIIENIDKLVPQWKNLFGIDEYSKKIKIVNNTDSIFNQNILNLSKFLSLHISQKISVQQQYLQDYFFKIKFISNFNTLE